MANVYCFVCLKHIFSNFNTHHKTYCKSVRSLFFLNNYNLCSLINENIDGFVRFIWSNHYYQWFFTRILKRQNVFSKITIDTIFILYVKWIRLTIRVITYIMHVRNKHSNLERRRIFRVAAAHTVDAIRPKSDKIYNIDLPLSVRFAAYDIFLLLLKINA